MYIKKLFAIVLMLASVAGFAQSGGKSLSVLTAKKIQWTPDGNGYYLFEGTNIVKVDLKTKQKTTLLGREQLTPTGKKAIDVKAFQVSDDGKRVLLNTNTQRVWRYNTRGDYWLYEFDTKNLSQLGANLPSTSLMYAKISPDARRVAFVSKHNIYVEDLATHQVKQLTQDGTDRIINGTFDWAYEEEFDCRDGFRWSPDGQSIAYWQIDARNIKNFLMINNTDSLYSFVVPVEYPKVGEAPSACRIGIIDVASGRNTWMKIEGDAQQNYIPRMEWASKDEIIVEQLNRKQNLSKVIVCNTKTGAASTIRSETDEAWIDTKSRWNDGDPSGWEWIAGGKEFVWVSEKDGWRHLYRVSKDGKNEKLITKGNYDVIQPLLIDEKTGFVYFTASPSNATQKYLFRTKLDGSSASPERLSPATQVGSHEYELSPNGTFAKHSFSSSKNYPLEEFVTLPNHQSDNPPAQNGSVNNAAEFFKIKTADGVEMDGWIMKPRDFDSTKKYPVVFHVYGEPAAQTVKDEFGAGYNFLYNGDFVNKGYIYISLDNRGTPAPKGRAWRKAIYRQIGRVNARDQAMATREILKWKYIDPERVAVWGWSGGGSMTLNLLFQYPDIYKTGISIAAVANQLFYDNIYQERYMGIPQENREDFIAGSPITHAKGLKGNLLYIHGTGDDNVHYQNAEALINELIKQGKVFQMMAYPNRTHSISEGAGTFNHLKKLFTSYLNQYCPPGGK
jgi:dipeptidyl-peptidase 4